jgi:hypothetical protein
MSLSGLILAEVMTGTYERSRAADKRTYEGTYERRFLSLSQNNGLDADCVLV